DTATCYCAKWKSEPQASVGAAVDEWIGHVLSLLPAPTAPASGAELRDLLAIYVAHDKAMRRPPLHIREKAEATLSSPAPPEWEAAREALEKLINKLDA